MNNNIFQELIKKQRKNLHSDKKLSLSDLKRIASYLNSSIFTNDCSFWNGYVTVSKLSVKSETSFVNFFFNGKKQALHRILYYNFIDDLNENEYLKFSCENKGKCCTLTHFTTIKEKNIQSEPLNNIVEDNIVEINDSKKESKNKKSITVEF
jgi:hypothetical protein